MSSVMIIYYKVTKGSRTARQLPQEQYSHSGSWGFQLSKKTVHLLQDFPWPRPSHQPCALTAFIPPRETIWLDWWLILQGAVASFLYVLPFHGCPWLRPLLDPDKSRKAVSEVLNTQSRNSNNYTRTVLKAWFILSTALTIYLSCRILSFTAIASVLFGRKEEVGGEGGKWRKWRREKGREGGKETERKMPLIVFSLH